MKHKLTARELEVLQMIIYEHTTHEIADKLCIHSETIRSHRKKLLAKLGARNVAGMVRRAFEYQLVQSEPLHID